MKVYTLILFLLFTSSVGFSQSTEFSLKGGLNVNDLGGAKIGIYNTAGFHVGMALEFIANSNFSLQPELMFSQQGGSWFSNRDVKNVYNYLNVPVLIKWYVFNDMDVHIGPQFGLLLSAHNKFRDGGSLKITDQIRTFDAGIAGGTRYKFHDDMAVSLRYYLGILNTNNTDVVFENRYTNRVFQASFIYIL